MNLSRFNYQYSHDHAVGEVTDTITGISTKCVLMNDGNKRGAQIAYLGARLSRSRDSIYSIIDSVSDNNVDSDKRIEKITVSYGHRSVGDMANINVFIDGVPMFTAMKLFYLIPALSGQENSTRYIDFKNYSYLNPQYTLSELTDEYHDLMTHWMKLYDKAFTAAYEELREQYNPSNKREETALTARALDCARQYIPMGITTNLFIQASATQWSILISKLRGSIYYVDRILGDSLFELLSGNEELTALGYTPEAPGLIRHAEPQYYLRDMYNELFVQLKKDFTNILSLRSEVTHLHSFSLLDRIAKLLTASDITVSNSQSVQSYLSIMLRHCNRHKEMPAIADAGYYNLRCVTDVGSLKDFNRHRSLERFIPYLEDEYRICKESTEFLPAHYRLNNSKPLVAEANSLLKRVIAYSNKVLEKNQCSYDNPAAPGLLEWIKYLIPHGAVTVSELGMSLKDLSYIYDLRVRPGGHINYRLEVQKWAQLLGVFDPHKEVTFSREQFYDRS